MRALTYLFAGLALNLVACGASESAGGDAAGAACAARDRGGCGHGDGRGGRHRGPTAVATAAPVATAALEAAKPASACPANMVLVPGGTFTLKQPKHEAKVAAFCMDVNETTADEYSACVKAGSAPAPTSSARRRPRTRRPAAAITPSTASTSEQANAYARRRASGSRPRKSGSGRRAAARRPPPSLGQREAQRQAVLVGRLGARGHVRGRRHARGDSPWASTISRATSTSGPRRSPTTPARCASAAAELARERARGGQGHPARPRLRGHLPLRLPRHPLRERAGEALSGLHVSGVSAAANSC